MVLRLSIIFILFLSSLAVAAESNIHVGYEAQLYRPGIEPSPFHIFTLGGVYSYETKDYESNIDFDFAFNPEKFSVWAIRSENLYWSVKEKSTQFFLGRRSRNWNELDSTWNLSLVQPIDQWDRFRSNQQGLLGAFLDLNFSPVEVHLFASYLMYPENVPTVVIEDQAFQPYHSQAVSSIPESITLLNQSTRLGYEIDYPNIADVLLRPSLMMSIESEKNSAFLFRLLYGYKPVNYFNFALTGSNAIANNQILIHVKPRLLNHQILAGDLGLRGGKNQPFSLGLSFVVDSPDKEVLGSEYTYAPVTRSTLVSPWISFGNESIKISFSQLIWTGGLSEDVGPFANPGQAVLSSHLFYRNASQTKIEMPVPFLLAGASIHSKWVHEYDIGADWISGDLFIPIATQNYKIQLTVGGDLVQTVLYSNPNLGGELLSDLSPLDRARLGVQIAF